MRPTTPWTLIPTVALLTLLLAPAPSRADEPSATDPAEPPTAIAPVAAGLLIGRDPVTGVLGVPTDEQARELLATWADKRALDQSGEDLVPFALDGGGSGLFLGGLLRHAAVVHRGGDGSLHFGCGDAAHTAAAVVGTAPASTAPDGAADTAPAGDAKGWPLQ